MAKDRLQYFRPEARDLLEVITKSLLHLDKGLSPGEALRGVLRAAHTLKGAAGVVKLSQVADLAHQLEDVLAPCQQANAAPPRQTIDEALRIVDRLSCAMADLEHSASLGVEGREEGTGFNAQETIRVDVHELGGLVDGISEVGVQIDALRQVAERTEDLHRCIDALVAEMEPGATPNPRGGTHPDRLRRTVGAVQEIVTEMRRHLADTVHRSQREIVDIRNRADRLRLLPVSVLFSDIERAARDAAQSLGKGVTFEALGGEQRLDAYVLSQLRVALLHIVRNAVVHGIEDERTRLALGKPPIGRIDLRVKRRGYHIAFECSDDGRGIDVEALRRVTRENHILSAQEAEALDLPEALSLIFRPGVTTTQEASLVSGRGIGLDAVKDVATRLKGRAEARSEPNQGMTVEVVVPLSLTSVEMILLEQGRARVSLPFVAVHRVLRLKRTEIARISERESVLISGEALPFRDLRVLLAGGSAQHSGETITSVLVIEADSGRAAIGVDRFLGTRYEVIHPLPRTLEGHPLLAGASFDSEGNPRLVLDPGGVVEAVRRESAPAPELPPETTSPILIVDDSLTTRMLEQTILEANGYEVDLATSGEEALKKAHKRRFGLMLVDVEMPGMSGFDFLERTRADPELREVPAILVTTRGSDEDRRRGMQVGARAYLLKSEFDEAVLLQTIRRVLG